MLYKLIILRARMESRRRFRSRSWIRAQELDWGVQAGFESTSWIGEQELDSRVGAILRNKS